MQEILHRTTELPQGSTATSTQDIAIASSMLLALFLVLYLNSEFEKYLYVPRAFLNICKNSYGMTKQDSS
jgi:hypothetical protein